MSVFKFFKHLGAYAEKLFRGHAVADFCGISVVHLLPVNVFVLKEAVMAVESRPQRLEIACRRVGKLGLVVACREACNRQQHNQYV